MTSLFALLSGRSSYLRSNSCISSTNLSHCFDWCQNNISILIRLAFLFLYHNFLISWLSCAYNGQYHGIRDFSFNLIIHLIHSLEDFLLLWECLRSDSAWFCAYCNHGHAPGLLTSCSIKHCILLGLQITHGFLVLFFLLINMSLFITLKDPDVWSFPHWNFILTPLFFWRCRFLVQHWGFWHC